MLLGLSRAEQVRLVAAGMGLVALARSVLVLMSGRLGWSDALVFIVQTACICVLAVATLSQFSARYYDVSAATASDSSSTNSADDAANGKSLADTAHIFDWLRSAKGKKFATMEDNLVERWKLSSKVASRIRRFVDCITNDFVKFWYYASKLT